MEPILSKYNLDWNLSDTSTIAESETQSDEIMSLPRLVNYDHGSLGAIAKNLSDGL